ncbi:MAG TPA: thiamine pyrophosphate-dependent dehydrogenase E1 component subunit alpha [bacterium]|nr:thiamine pyrophosphate-dependent dehydrogenase E1 component subunit alpha [Bryobacteraceae bacterium]HEV2284224.1 thiamine pyrophosphate-dependent dehydrogenase E1 component subunit alpha [bacterium]
MTPNARQAMAHAPGPAAALAAVRGAFPAQEHTPDLPRAAGAAPPAQVDWLLERWHSMARIRLAEEAIAGLVESGEAGGPCHLYIGQEAIAAGVSAALEARDTVWGGHRSHGHYLARGGSLEALFGEILGRATGCARGRGGSMHLIAPAAGLLGTVPIVAGTVPLAVGAAFAAKFTGSGAVAVAFFGDGTLEEGHVHESLNLAGLYKLPVLFVCENNLYASHMHWSERRVSDNLDTAGVFHGVPGERVDGNDVEAVFQAAREAVERARSGGGPSLIECRTFRWRGHVGASFDRDVGVLRRGELAEWLPRDPLAALERRLAARGVSDFEERRAAVRAEVARALAAARAAPAPAPSRVLEFVGVDTGRAEFCNTGRGGREATCER